MKVECVRILDDSTGEPIESSPWLTVGKVYAVLSVEFEERGRLFYRFIADDGFTPAVNDAIQFRIVSDALPPNWIANYKAGSYFELAPASWTAPGFWERYFDRDPTAVAEFETEKDVIMRSGA